MYAFRNILLTVALLSAAPLSLAAPAAEQDGIAQYEPRATVTDDIFNTYDPPDVDEDEDITDETPSGAEIFARARCVVRRKGMGNRDDCNSNVCRPGQWCEKKKGGCRMKRKTNKRPSGCDACKCVKA